MTYNADFSEMRALADGKRRYVKMRAVANGPDSYNSIFTDKARKSIVEQLKQGSVKSRMLHKDTVFENVKTYLSSQLSKVKDTEKTIVETLLGQLPMAEFPPAKIVDAQFETDNALVVTAEFNEELAKVSDDERMKLDAYWDMLNNGAINGASMVFSEVRSFKSDGKLFIDALRVDGIDFVDRASHKDTRILETFVRAAAEAIPNQSPNITSENNQGTKKMVETEFKKVEEVLEKATKLVNEIEAEKASKLAEQSKAAEAARVAELDNLKQQLSQREKEAEELAQIAKEAVEKLKAKPSTITVSNPLAESHFTQQAPRPTSKSDLLQALKAKFDK